MKDQLDCELREEKDRYTKEGYGADKIFGMRIEVRDDLDNGIQFIIS